MSAINWLISKAVVTETAPELFDGQMVSTKTYFFDGVLPSKMAREVKALSTQFRGTNRQSVYNWSDENKSYSAKFGATKSTNTSIQFTATEYIFHN